MFLSSFHEINSRLIILLNNKLLTGIQGKMLSKLHITSLSKRKFIKIFLKDISIIREGHIINL